MSIPFTQYLRPHGTPKSIQIEMDADTEEKATKLLASGCHFDAEVLMTGIVSLTCERGDDCLSHELCPNGKAVIEAVRKVVHNAFDRVGDET